MTDKDKCIEELKETVIKQANFIKEQDARIEELEVKLEEDK